MSERRLIVYVMARGDEIDVYDDEEDAEEAAAITGLRYQEQVVFENGAQSTRDWLQALRDADTDEELEVTIKVRKHWRADVIRAGGEGGSNDEEQDLLLEIAGALDAAQKGRQDGTV
jgi:hypothetical protein